MCTSQQLPDAQAEVSVRLARRPRVTAKGDPDTLVASAKPISARSTSSGRAQRGQPESLVAERRVHSTEADEKL